MTNERIMLNEITDTDRLDFLLKYFCVDDIGDECYVPGVIIKSESLEDMLTWGSEAQIKRYNKCDNSNLRAIIDKAILIKNEQITRKKEWVVGVALLLQGNLGFFEVCHAEKPARHDIVVLKALQHYSAEVVSRGIQGFWTSREHFVDRKEAAKIAYEAGQIAEPADCLVSEDLW